jgi:hypothetical protein
MRIDRLMSEGLLNALRDPDPAVVDELTACREEGHGAPPAPPSEPLTRGQSRTTETTTSVPAVPTTAESAAGRSVPTIELFATAAHLRATPRSQDPLGFGTAVNALAGYFSPSLTASTVSARYFAVLCAGSRLRGPRQSSKDAVLRFERIWAFGSVIAGQGQGVLGTRSAQDQVQLTGSKKLVPVTYHFFRDGSQARQGVWGLYSAAAERLGLHHAGICTPRGEELAAPIEDLDTDAQLGLAAAVRAGRTFRRDSAWTLGEDFGVDTALDSREAVALAAGLQADDPQHRLARIVRTWNDPTEGDLLARLADHGARTAGDLRRVAAAALALEDLYLPASRVVDALWKGAEQSMTASKVLGQRAVARAAKLVPKAAESLRHHLSDVAPLGPQMSLEFDQFLAALEASPPATEAVADQLIGRHTHVQQVKGADPWLERRGGDLELGAPRADLAYDPFDSAQRVDGHLFRLSAMRNIASSIHRAGVAL